MRVAVMASGGGTDFQSLIDARDAGRLPNAEIVCLVANRACGAVGRAESNGIEHRVISASDEGELIAYLSQKRVDLVVLAGYLKILSANFLKNFKTINIHPALLPKFGGAGFYGGRVHAAVIAAGETESGATVHYVTPEIDAGEIILQRRVPVLPDDTAESLQARVLRAEHEILPEAVAILSRPNILIVGSGAREHALAWKIRQSPHCGKLYCAPGNAGTAQVAENIAIKADQIEKLADFAENNAVNLTVVGPDDPLAAGIVDEFNKRSLKIFGPTRKAAQIEASKAFSKTLMERYGIPTAEYAVFSDIADAEEYLDEKNRYPVVIKADGLALGKGVIICQTREEAQNALCDMLLFDAFGAAGKRVVIEEFLTGRELSVFAFCDGKSVLPFASACDYKRAGDGDQGLNTGGMGAISPCPFYSAQMHAECMEKIYIPTVEAMADQGRPFTGFLYFGLIETADGVKVIEYNARMGDPETQVVVPRLESDIIEIICACLDGKLDGASVKLSSAAACCVVLASKGYPEKYQTGFEISLPAEGLVFHAGTKLSDGKIVTSGGRVLSAVGLGENLGKAVAAAYTVAESVAFEGKTNRGDIGNVRAKI